MVNGDLPDFCCSFKKFQTLRTQTYHISFWSGWFGDYKYIICFPKYLNFAKTKAIMYFAKFLNAKFLKKIFFLKFFFAKFEFFAKQIIYLESPDHPFQNDKWLGLSDKFPFRWYIICWGNLSLSKIIGGGHPAPPHPPHPFILRKRVVKNFNHKIILYVLNSTKRSQYPNFFHFRSCNCNQFYLIADKQVMVINYLRYRLHWSHSLQTLTNCLGNRMCRQV